MRIVEQVRARIRTRLGLGNNPNSTQMYKESLLEAHRGTTPVGVMPLMKTTVPTGIMHSPNVRGERHTRLMNNFHKTYPSTRPTLRSRVLEAGEDIAGMFGPARAIADLLFEYSPGPAQTWFERDRVKEVQGFTK